MQISGFHSQTQIGQISSVVGQSNFKKDLECFTTWLDNIIKCSDTKIEDSESSNAANRIKHDIHNSAQQFIYDMLTCAQEGASLEKYQQMAEQFQVSLSKIVDDSFADLYGTLANNAVDVQQLSNNLANSIHAAKSNMNGFNSNLGLGGSILAYVTDKNESVDSTLTSEYMKIRNEGLIDSIDRDIHVKLDKLSEIVDSELDKGTKEIYLQDTIRDSTGKIDNLEISVPTQVAKHMMDDIQNMVKSKESRASINSRYHQLLLDNVDIKSITSGHIFTKAEISKWHVEFESLIMNNSQYF